MRVSCAYILVSKTRRREITGVKVEQKERGSRREVRRGALAHARVNVKGRDLERGEKESGSKNS